MTNITVAVFIAVATNWSGLVYQADKEVGFIVTNHVARIEYAGKTNEFTLLSEPSNIYTLRPFQVNNGTLWVTNAMQLGDITFTPNLLYYNEATNWYVPLTDGWTNWRKAQ